VITCPNCHVAMTDQAVETFSGVPPGAGSCATCNLLWFDRGGSVSLTPRTVLNLFQYIAKTAGEGKTTLASGFQCPRCSGNLALTYDLQRNTRFTYWRCANDTGQLFTFNHFLREKNFIRSPTLAELARLRDTVRQISCSQCGGPIDLTKDTACPHCGAPIALVDPDGVAKAVHDLTLGNAGIAQATQEQTSAAVSNAQLDALFRQHPSDDDGGSYDLLAIGIGAVGALIGGILIKS
jgi:hypothetical protein